MMQTWVAMKQWGWNWYADRGEKMNGHDTWMWMITLDARHYGWGLWLLQFDQMLDISYARLFSESGYCLH